MANEDEVVKVMKSINMANVQVLSYACTPYTPYTQDNNPFPLQC
jgi:hypothetical protein